MSKRNSLEKKKLRTSFLSVVISMSLVLFTIASIGIIFIGAKQLSDKVKEQFTLNISLKNTSDSEQIKTLKKSLKISKYTKEVTFISKEQGAEEYIAETGEDFIAELGTNPILNTLVLTIKPEFVTPEKMDEIALKLGENENIYEVYYQKEILNNIYAKFDKAVYWLLGITGLFLIIFIALINSSVRLAIYSKRFLIKTMQLVGATKSFIRRPFLLQSIGMGILSGLIAICAISGLLYYGLQKLQLMHEITSEKIQLLVGLYLAILLLGIVIAWVSTYFATRKYLKLRTEQLY